MLQSNRQNNPNLVAFPTSKEEYIAYLNASVSKIREACQAEGIGA